MADVCKEGSSLMGSGAVCHVSGLLRPKEVHGAALPTSTALLTSRTEIQASAHYPLPLIVHLPIVEVCELSHSWFHRLQGGIIWVTYLSPHSHLHMYLASYCVQIKWSFHIPFFRHNFLCIWKVDSESKSFTILGAL